MSVLRWLITRLSVFVHSNRAFVMLMATVAALKLLLSALIPASSELAAIALDTTIETRKAAGGPWTALDAQIISFWRSLFTGSTVQNWWQASPITMTMDLRLLSLLIRLPAFALDIAIAVCLYLTATKIGSSTQARLASLIWFLNPYVFFAAEILGVPDLAATCLTVIASLLLIFRRTALGALALAAGIWLKLFPILLLLPLVHYLEIHDTRYRSRILLIGFALLGFIAYLSWVFYSGSASLSALMDYTPVTQPVKVLFEFTPGGRISSATFALVIIYFAVFRFARNSNLHVSDMVLPVLLVYYALSDPLPQYFLWALPFLTLDVVLAKRRHIILLVTMLAVLFGVWFILSSGFATPSGYSLLLVPLNGSDLPWYSQAMLSFLQNETTAVLLFPLLSATLFATYLIYALEIVRGWFLKTGSIEHSDSRR